MSDRHTDSFVLAILTPYRKNPRRRQPAAEDFASVMALVGAAPDGWRSLTEEDGFDNLEHAHPPERVFPPPEERIKGTYETPPSTDRPIRKCYDELQFKYERMVEYRGIIILRRWGEVMAHDPLSFRQETRAMIQYFEVLRQTAAHLRQEVEDLGGAPFPEPTPLQVPFVPEGY